MSDHDDKESENVKNDWFYEQNNGFLPVTRFFFLRLRCGTFLCDDLCGRELEKKKPEKLTRNFPSFL